LPVILQAQKEMNWWYFGNNSGLNFGEMQPDPNGSGVMLPTPVTGPISTREGCFTLSDNQGGLLMSSDGRFVYNRLGQLMPQGSGLKGHDSATQSGIVVPVPGGRNKYYIITVNALEQTSNYGVNYYTVDLTEDGGMGDVIDTGTNLLTGAVCENIAAVRHKNNKDYWLIHRTGQYFYVWAITSAGFSAPVTYDAILDIMPDQPSGGGIGELRFNADGTRFAHVNCNYSS
jgi:hypothetical protein